MAKLDTYDRDLLAAHWTLVTEIVQRRNHHIEAFNQEQRLPALRHRIASDAPWLIAQVDLDAASIRKGAVCENDENGGGCRWCEQHARIETVVALAALVNG